MRRNVAVISCWLALATCAWSTGLPSLWSGWRFSRSIKDVRPNELNYLALSPDVVAHSEAHSQDFRVVDETGAEIPFVIRKNVSATNRGSWEAQVRENSFVPGKYTQVVLDLGKDPRFHNTVEVETPESDFITWVQVEASDDARIWRIVKSRAPISRFRKEGLDGNQKISYSENNARFLRLQLREGESQFPVTGATIYPTASTEKDIVPAQWITVQAARPPDVLSEKSETTWNIDLGEGQVPLDALDFTTNQSDFYRGVRLLSSIDGKEWTYSGSGDIYRYQEEKKKEESLRVPVTNFSNARYWKVQILNGNDAPLSGVTLSLVMSPQLLLFRPGVPAVDTPIELRTATNVPRHQFTIWRGLCVLPPENRPMRILLGRKKKTRDTVTRGPSASGIRKFFGFHWGLRCSW